ncbi:MAG: LacI family DNA-binding transcriptional regulator [Candidatus Sumerlaeia bacterium]|nr:LacI family DNA-binding transcriptional regulator [Candidatus Sumerlaeia bacterium]
MTTQIRTKNLSIHDVAAEAKVSIATVSRVINGKDRVAPSTRTRVEEALKKLDFRPNRQARSLGLRRTNTIGLVVPDLLGEFFSELMHGVDTAARDSNMNLMIIRAVDSEEEEAVCEEFLGSGAVDGLIFMISQLDDKAVHELARYKQSLLVIDRDLADLGIDNVLVDNRSGGYEATCHLIEESKVDHLLFIGGPEKNIDSGDRLLGFKDAVRRHDMKLEENFSFFTDYNYDNACAVAESIVRRIKSSKGRWGIVAANDSVARGVIDTLLDHKISVPDKVSVVGYDDSQLARLTRPTLTSVRIPLRELGRTALCLLRDRINGVRLEQSTIVFKGRLIRRGSSIHPGTTPAPQHES